MSAGPTEERTEAYDGEISRLRSSRSRGPRPRADSRVLLLRLPDAGAPSCSGSRMIDNGSFRENKLVLLSHLAELISVGGSETYMGEKKSHL